MRLGYIDVMSELIYLRKVNGASDATISRAQVGPYLGQLPFFFKLTADQGLVVDWIAGSRSDTHTHTHTHTHT